MEPSECVHDVPLFIPCQECRHMTDFRSDVGNSFDAALSARDLGTKIALAVVAVCALYLVWVVVF